MGIIGDRAREAYVQTLEATTGIQVFGNADRKYPAYAPAAGRIWRCP